jgi:Patatin-like phospholipase/Transposase
VSPSSCLGRTGAEPVSRTAGRVGERSGGEGQDPGANRRSWWAGSDVGKAWLDGAVRPTGEQRRVGNAGAMGGQCGGNEEEKITEAVAWVGGRAPRVLVLDATGGAARLVVGALGGAGRPVAVLPPRPVRECAKASGRLATSDRLDAQDLAHLAAAVHPRPQLLPDAQGPALAAGGERGRPVVARRTAEQNRLGRAALRTKTVPEAERRAVIAHRLPTDQWPQPRLLIPAVNAETGVAVVFDRDSGVPLIDAVAASCAVPLVWPPVTIHGQRYIDGGARAVANVDLAKGCERIVVIAPSAAAPRRADRPAAQVAALGRGVRAVIVSPNRAARAAIGFNVLDPARRAPSAAAGRTQAVDEADRVRAVWG